MKDINPMKHIYYPISNIKVIKGDGIYLFDSNGKRYIDCASATFNLSLGYSNHDVIDEVKKQMDSLIHVTTTFQTEPINKLIQKLVSIVPANLSRIHLKVSGGSTANEGAIKMAQLYTKKRDIISLFRSHLGQTYMTMSISGNSFRREDFPQMFTGSLIVPDPYCYRCFYNQTPETCNMLCVERINDYIEYASSGQIACLIVEPISGNGGNIVPPRRYFKELKKLCDEHNIVLIFDEIQTGFGRTGELFAADYFNVYPNIMTVGKGLGGTGFQIAAILAEEKFEGMHLNHHSFTYGSNTLSASAAYKTLEIIAGKRFLDNVKYTGTYILRRLDKLKERHSFIGDVRGVGLMIGIEIIKEDKRPDPVLTNKIISRALDYGLIVRTSQYGRGNVLKVRPPLIISISEAEELCDKLAKIFNEIK